MHNVISIIIPAYNVGAFIRKCLDSVVMQTHRYLEIIIVNDGSTDNTAEIIGEYTNDSRIKYIEQQNKGVSAARNAGIEAATGKYLAFVDSDDYLELNMYAELYAALENNDADVAVCNYNLVYDDHVDQSYSLIHDEVVDVSADVSGYVFKYCACPKPNNYIWTRLYYTELVRKSGVRFQNYKLGDDTLFNFMLLPHISRVVYVSGGLYNYFQRSNSNVYTVAKRSNLAEVYAETFAALTDYYKAGSFDAGFLPIHAYTRLRSIVFYSRLAGISEEEISDNIAKGFLGAEIAEYLKDQSQIDRYAAINGFSVEHANEIKHIMQAAAENPSRLIGK